MFDAVRCPKNAGNEQEFEDHHESAQPQRLENETQERQYHLQIGQQDRQYILWTFGKQNKNK